MANATVMGVTGLLVSVQMGLANAIVARRQRRSFSPYNHMRG